MCSSDLGQTVIGFGHGEVVSELPGEIHKKRMWNESRIHYPTQIRFSDFSFYVGETGPGPTRQARQGQRGGFGGVGLGREKAGQWIMFAAIIPLRVAILRLAGTNGCTLSGHSFCCGFFCQRRDLMWPGRTRTGGKANSPPVGARPAANCPT